MGRHRRQPERGTAPSTSGRAAVSTVAALGFGVLPFGGLAAAAPEEPPAPQPATSEQGVGGTPCDDDRIKACVDLSENEAWLLDGDGKVVDGPVTSNHGGRGEETPTGDFVVQRKDRYHESKEFDDASMPYAVFFDNEGRAFHEGDPGRQSAGCVRLGHEDAKRFFEHLEPNDRVQIVP